MVSAPNVYTYTPISFELGYDFAAVITIIIHFAHTMSIFRGVSGCGFALGAGRREWIMIGSRKNSKPEKMLEDSDKSHPATAGFVGRLVPLFLFFLPLPDCFLPLSPRMSFEIIANMLIIFKLWFNRVFFN